MDYNKKAHNIRLLLSILPDKSNNDSYLEIELDDELRKLLLKIREKLEDNLYNIWDIKGVKKYDTNNNK